MRATGWRSNRNMLLTCLRIRKHIFYRRNIYTVFFFFFFHVRPMIKYKYYLIAQTRYLIIFLDLQPLYSYVLQNSFENYFFHRVFTQTRIVTIYGIEWLWLENILKNTSWEHWNSIKSKKLLHTSFRIM